MLEFLPSMYFLLIAMVPKTNNSLYSARDLQISMYGKVNLRKRRIQPAISSLYIVAGETGYFSYNYLHLKCNVSSMTSS